MEGASADLRDDNLEVARLKDLGRQVPDPPATRRLRIYVRLWAFWRASSRSSTPGGISTDPG